MREYVGMVVLDLQKAFDTVNHKIQINKLKALGLNQIAINWVVSYLRDREQIVDIAGTYSQACNITCGVPQGSILGPLLFLIYVNGMKTAVKCKLILYADVSALLVSGKDVVKIEQVLSRELKAVNEWLEERLQKIAKIGLKIRDKISFDKLEVATHFNKFFTNIAEKLVNKLPPITGKYGERICKTIL